MFKVRFYLLRYHYRKLYYYIIFYDLAIGRILSVDWNLQRLIQSVSLSLLLHLFKLRMDDRGDPSVLWTYCFVLKKLLWILWKRPNWDLLCDWSKTSSETKKKLKKDSETGRNFLRLLSGIKDSSQDKVEHQNLDVIKYSGFIQNLKVSKPRRSTNDFCLLTGIHSLEKWLVF